MENLKYRPMAVTGFSALALMFAAVAADKAFLCGIISLCFGTALAVAAFVSGKISKLSVLLYLSAALVLSGALLVSYDLYSVRPAEKYIDTESYVTAKLTDKKSESNNSDCYILKIETINSEKISSSLRLYMSAPLDYEPGSTIGFKAHLKSAETADTLSGRLYLKSENIVLSAFLYNNEGIELIRQDDGPVSSAVYKLRRHIKTSIMNLLPGDIGAVACAMLTGDKSGLSDSAALDFSLTGVSHLFAVSGLHLSVWVLSVYELLKKLRVPGKINAVLAAVFTVCFMALTGFTASVCRAGIMLIAVMLGRIFSGRSDPFNSLGLSCVVLLIAKPCCAVSLSLLLSLFSTLGIVTVYPYVRRHVFARLEKDTPEYAGNIIKAAISVPVITLGASLFTLPVNAFITGGISVIAPVTNLLVSFAATVCMICGGAAAVFSGIGFICRPAGLVCGIFSKYILSVTHALSASPVTVADLNSVFVKAAVIVIVTGMIIIMMLSQNGRNRLRAAVILLLCVSTVTYSSFLIYSGGKTFIDVFSVGDGMCVCVKNGFSSMAVGCGGSDYYSSGALAESLGGSAGRLIIPDENRWNSGSLHYLSSKCRFTSVIAGYDSAGVDLLYPGAVHKSRFALNPWDDASFEFCNQNGSSYAYCIFEGCSVLFVFTSGEDFAMPDKCTSADLLIMSYYPPENIDLSGYKNIIISSSSQIFTSIADEHPDTRFISTSGCEKISLVLKSGNITINRGR